MSTVLRIENVSKRYQLGMVDRKAIWKDLRAKFRGEPPDDGGVFWPLRNISFDVKEGEVVGLIGRNGAGKSTLLKIISQITLPTTGSVKLRGRVASLLEVGTGFHNELSGRDNVFLNGMILGMTRREVARKFDEIVAFSGVEKFIDTPVKRYSVGMRVRLAFAVAAHLDAEILLVDEVLAVGDAEFQKRCLGRLDKVAHSGRTVVFVSHDTAALESLCSRGVVLKGGQLVFDGTQTAAIEHYTSTMAASSTDLRSHTERSGRGGVRGVQIALRNSRGEDIPSARSGEDIEIALDFEREGSESFPHLAVQLSVTTRSGAPVFTHANWLNADWFGALPERGTLLCRIPRLPLPSGHFRVGYRLLPNLQIRGDDTLDAIDSALDLQVEPGTFFKTGKLPSIKTGVCLVDAGWHIESSVPEQPVINGNAFEKGCVPFSNIVSSEAAEHH